MLDNVAENLRKQIPKYLHLLHEMKEKEKQDSGCLTVFSYYCSTFLKQPIQISSQLLISKIVTREFGDLGI